jgi:hypothetical protein
LRTALLSRGAVRIFEIPSARPIAMNHFLVLDSEMTGCDTLSIHIASYPSVISIFCMNSRERRIYAVIYGLGKN